MSSVAVLRLRYVEKLANALISLHASRDLMDQKPVSVRMEIDGFTTWDARAIECDNDKAQLEVQRVASAAILARWKADMRDALTNAISSLEKELNAINMAKDSELKIQTYR